MPAFPWIWVSFLASAAVSMSKGGSGVVISLGNGIDRCLDVRDRSPWGPLQWFSLTESNQLDVEEQNAVLYIHQKDLQHETGETDLL